MALGLLLIGPPVMTAFLGNKGYSYGRFGLAIVGLGMGLHLISGTLNQAALARGRAKWAAAAWLIAATAFVIFVAAPTITSEVTRVEVGYFGATAVLCGLLTLVYRRGTDRAGHGPGRRRDRGVGRRRIVSPEHGRAGDEQVGSRLASPRGRSPR